MQVSVVVLLPGLLAASQAPVVVLARCVARDSRYNSFRI